MQPTTTTKRYDLQAKPIQVIIIQQIKSEKFRINPYNLYFKDIL